MTPRGASTGARQPWSAHARLNGVNTAYGVPSALVTRPGATAYGDPVRTSSMPCSASASLDRRGRARRRTGRVGGDVDPVGADRAGRQHHPADRVAAHHLEAAAPPVRSRSEASSARSASPR